MTAEQLMGTVLKKAYYTEPEVCELAGLAYETLRRREHRHRLPNRGQRTRITDYGRCQLFYPVDQVAEWLVELGTLFARKREEMK